MHSAKGHTRVQMDLGLEVDSKVTAYSMTPNHKFRASIVLVGKTAVINDDTL